MRTWHKEIKELAGALLVVEGVKGARYEEIVGIRLEDGRELEGMVLEAHSDKAVVQVLGSTIGIGPKNARVKLTGNVSKLEVGESMRARIFSGSGKIIDSGPVPLAEESRAINGEPMNPYARELPDEFIQTGISSIDALNTLVRGQKLPIFSLSGLPHPALAAQIARQSTVLSDKADFMVVFGAIGVTHEESRYFIEDFQRTGALENSVLFINHADDPVVERIMLPRLALTTAEYFAFKKNTHVLVILTDITNYCEALREMSASRKEIPGRRGYPGYMYTDLANLYERAGVVKGSKGSVTQLPILTMPDDDKTHPIPDLTGYITEGQITMSRELHTQGYFPPVDVLGSLSRLKNKGIGEGKTREDHGSVSDQIFASYAKSKQVKELAQILGESALTTEDKMFLKFNTEFEKRFINQGPDENRTIEETLDLCWELLSLIPRTELKRVKPEMVKKYLKDS